MIAGADPNVLDIGKRSPLHLAAEAGHHRVVRVILLKGADVDKLTCLSKTPLRLAASKGHTLCVSERLLGRADKDRAGSFLGTTPLVQRGRKQPPRCRQEALTAGADSRRPTLGHYFPFDIAARRGHANILKAFLETGTEVVAADGNGWTALHGAASGIPSLDNRGTIRVLLEAGVNVNAKATCRSLYTPLHLTVDYRVASVGMVGALLEGGADVNARAERDQTPLHVAGGRSNVAAVELLLRCGVDEKLTNDDGDTPADVIGAADHAGHMVDNEADNQRILRMLARAPADMASPRLAGAEPLPPDQGGDRDRKRELQ
ncbi:similar to ankyrin 2,3/unc44 [Ectocarpus siliculosus]|uniref:Similar to ankyrin 2,3/unc44 n=1 Tax=Ectocarpus siliculosus TaxID=2880 RepID=D7G6Z8_ECTSI|nr:similar to ankyrin 2,3/unc44 [Ectocarpus siliculosus]|eukprot:CBJ25691.1 similar to ankyrin 2,3/unc44 [Ectocarpus siliculosus]